MTESLNGPIHPPAAAKLHLLSYSGLLDGLGYERVEGIVQQGEQPPRQGGQGEQDQQQGPPDEHPVNLPLHIRLSLCKISCVRGQLFWSRYLIPVVRYSSRQKVEPNALTSLVGVNYDWASIAFPQYGGSGENLSILGRY